MPGADFWAWCAASDAGLTIAACAVAEVTRARAEAARRAVLAELARHWRCYGTYHGLTARDLAARVDVPEDRARKALRALTKDGLTWRACSPHRPYEFPRYPYRLTADGELAAMTMRGRHARTGPQPVQSPGLTPVRRRD